MKRYLLLLAAACSFLMIQSCAEVSTRMSEDYPSDYDVNYALREVLEIDPVNVNGIDVYPYFDFFNSFRFSIHYKDGKIHSVEVDNGNIPFSPFAFDVPEGEFECWFDSERVPNAIRMAGTDDVIAWFSKGELYMAFQLDCEEINYQYRFREIAE